MFELGYKKQGPDSIGLKKTGSPKTGSQRDSTLADNVMACFFFNVKNNLCIILFMYSCMHRFIVPNLCVYECVCACVHANVSARMQT